MAVNLNANQANTLRGFLGAHHYADGYRYLRDVVNQQIQNEVANHPIPNADDWARTNDLMALSAWFNAAAHINANDGSLVSEFVRGTTEGVMVYQGASITDAQFQDASDRLGDKLLGMIIDNNSIDTAQNVVNLDIQNAEKELNMPAWGWAGAIMDFLPEPFGLWQDLASVPLDKAGVMSLASGRGIARAVDRMLDDGVISTANEIKSIIAADGQWWGDFFFNTNHRQIPCTAGRLPTIQYGSVTVYTDPDNDGDAGVPGETDDYSYTVTGSTPTFPADPLVLDLGHIVQTVGTDAGIQFDFTGNGIKHAAGWLGASNGFLVMDRNGNGVIDNGTELFGDSTPLYDAAGNVTGHAGNGYGALAAQDTNHDNVVNSSDANFSALRVWQDLNQDGVSQGNELFTLGQEGITQLNAYATVYNNAPLGNGNSIGGFGLYNHTVNGSNTTGFAYDVNFAQDVFVRTFANSIPITTAAQALPAMQGSGSLRDLREAASLQTTQGATLLASLTAFASADAMAQHTQMDALIADWIATSAQKTTVQKYQDMGLTVQYMDYHGVLSTDPIIGAPTPVSADQAAHISQMLGALEVFGGGDIPGGCGIGGGTVTITLYGETDLAVLEARYNAIKDSVFGALAMQTRLKPYLDSIGLNIDEGATCNST
jgi:hypothetical protein